jgi:hypothetical protein
MKQLFTTLVLLQSLTAFCGTRPITADTTGAGYFQKQLTTAGKGLAPVQGGSFKNPILTAGLSLKIGRLSYEPDLSLGMNGKPWIANNHLRFAVVHRKKVDVILGANLFLFFADIPAGGKNRLSAQRTLNYEGTATIKTSTKHLLFFSYAYSHGLDQFCLSGNIYAIGSSWSGIPASPRWPLSLDNQLFYLQLTNNTKGLFSSTKLSAKPGKARVSVYAQGLLAIRTAYPIERLQFNAGLSYSFR